MNKKGLTPIIAVILLLMMTVAAAGAAFFWFTRIQSELQGGTESYEEQLSEKVSAKVGVFDIDYNDATGNLSIYLQNQGNTPVPVSSSSSYPTTSWILQDSSLDTICHTTWASGTDAACVAGCGNNIDVHEIQRVILDLSGDCAISTYANDTAFYYKVDFSGVTSTGGQFLK